MLQKIRNSRMTKGVSFLLALQLFLSGMGRTVAYAGDGGPTQPEVHSFEPIGTDQMVDLFTGDFTYNIPLFNLPGPDGGYPINLAYHSGVQMDQEASWVGLGWNINMGTINRQVRNLPDDFGGSQEDNITIKTDMRPNWTVGAGVSNRLEVFGYDKSGTQVLPVAGSIMPQLNLYYNNYKGIGYTLDVSYNLSFIKTSDANTKVAGDLGYNLKLDSQEGISSGVYADVRTENDKWKTSSSISTDFNNRTGWKRGINVQSLINRSTKPNDRFQFGGASGGSTLSFSRTIVSMQVPNAMRGGNGSFSIGKGLNTTGVFKKNSAHISFQSSKLKNKNKSINYRGVGYLYYQQSLDSQAIPGSDTRVKDVSRDNDGMVHKDTRRLATPSLSYDIYSVTGQGIGNMFRPVRSDIATVVAPAVESKYYGGNAGVEKNVWGNTRIGIDIGFQYSNNKTDQWPNTNAANTLFVDTDASLTRSVYFKNYGELSNDDLTANYGATIATNKPVAYGLKGNDNFYDITNTDQYTNSAISIQTSRVTRRKRAVGVEAFTNGMIMDAGSSLIPEFDLSYYNAPSATGYNKLTGRADYDTVRTKFSKTQVGGYMATNDGGMRYVYGLPAQNQKERDVVFSVKETTGMLTSSKIASVPQTGGGVDYQQKGTDKYYNSVEKKAYAHSYLLTSILGLDYVDLDVIPGPSDGDLGYWVRFDYARAHSNYKWRSPYNGAIYDKGYNTAFTDGKARYSYGEKEVWYVATVETKTHVAEFIVSPRADCKQVADELNGGAASGAYYKLDRIDVYAKSERYKNGTFNSSAKPVQSCNFVYDYSLCQGVPDNSNTTTGTKGKLTLKSFYFTYRNNATGSTTPYSFEYNTQVGGTDIAYASDAVDRWGNYQPGGGAANIDYPYNDPYTPKATMDERAGLWNMKAINLPSGGRYEVDYESDSYAYVQNEVAMQLFQIASLEPYKDGSGALISPTTAIQHPKDAPDANRRVYFKLEQPIPTTTSPADQTKLMQKYIRPNEYLYFKVKINLTRNNSTKEYVGAYAQVKDISVDATSAVSGNYIWGYVTLDNLKVNGQNTHFHPFTEAGSRHIRYNQPQLLYDNAPNADLDQLSKSDIKNMGWSLLANSKDFVDLFKDFTAMLYGNGNDRLSDIELEKSYLRLRTPDKIKYGGGHRVKQVRIIDNWAASTLSGEASSTYGTVYEYDMTDENGDTISSGVAAYEPLVGGDEIALRNPVAGWEDKNILSKTMAQTYTEEPGNESLFPGPTVGYRQVKVLSLNTSVKNNNLSSPITHYGGITVHEFYTAKDYPVLTDNTELETDKTFRKSRLIVPALIVNVDRLRMAASQGYYIELNDMHGKPKGAREISFNASGTEEELSSVQYEYFDEAHLTTNRAGETFTTRSLKNDVSVLYKDIDPANNTQSDIRTSTLATEIEFVPETRYQQSRNISAGLQLNFERAATLVMFYPVPSFNWQEEKTGTVVTNKIVNKAGIVKKVTATQRGSVAETENLVFDDVTGMPLLTSLTNDYGNKIYNYSILAKDQYDGTGPAYLNIGKTALATAVGTTAPNGLQNITLSTPADAANFVRGDELLATPVMLSGGNYVDDGTRSKHLCYFNVAGTSPTLTLETASALSGIYRFTIIRSGRRNNLTTPISSITALSNPTIGRHVLPCSDRGGKFLQDYSILTMDNLLAVNAVELGNQWYKDTRQLSVVPGTWYDNAFYSKGFGASFAPVRSYAYIDDRSQTTTSGVTTVNLSTDGIMNGVPLFTWDRLQADPVGTGCATKWREVDRVTLKNPSSFDIESRNILQTYSSKLYGRSGTEPIAVAANARNVEIGSENFEEYPAGTLDAAANASNNLNFYSTISGTRYAQDRFDITSGANGFGLINLSFAKCTANYIAEDVVVRIHFDSYKLPASGINNPAQEVLVKLPFGQLFNDGTGLTKLVLLSTVNVPNYDDRKWRGEVFLKKLLPNYPSSGNSSVLVKDGVAHTGTKSLAIENVAGGKFLQGRLTLQEGKEYQFSGWFSTPENAYLLKSYDDLFQTKFQVTFMDATGTVFGSQTFNEPDILQGNFIDDWQKFTLNFTMPVGAVYAIITLPCAHEVFSTVLNDYVQVAYYDDLRLQPRDAGMDTYVYNQENQRLEAQLDANNYATFYYYDDEGNLFLVKRETEKGIITVQESRTYMQKH